MLTQALVLLLTAIASFVAGAKYGKKEYDQARKLYKDETQRATADLDLARDAYRRKLDELGTAVKDAAGKTVVVSGH